MTQLSTALAAEACVWMTAGVINFKLCDRDFDCEHCPLDAALRGERCAAAREAGIVAPHLDSAGLFPPDRLYSPGHTWLKPVGRGRRCFRLGLDSFAAAVIGVPQLIRCTGPRRLLDHGAAVCDLELEVGVLRLCAPIAGRSGRSNQRLRDDPGAVVSEPYGRGWIIELVPLVPEDVDGLLSSESALKQAALDLRRFRRRVAHHLLAEADSGEPPLGAEADWLMDLRRVLGGRRYLALVRDLVH